MLNPRSQRNPPLVDAADDLCEAIDLEQNVGNRGEQGEEAVPARANKDDNVQDLRRAAYREPALLAKLANEQEGLLRAPRSADFDVEARADG